MSKSAILAPVVKKKNESVHAYVLLLAMCVLAAVFTYLIPAGAYQRVKVDGRSLVVSDSYATVKSTPVSVFNLFNSIPKGWTQAADIMFLVFMVGAAIKVIEDTGVIDKVLLNSMTKLKGKEEVVVIIVSIILSIMGSTGTFSTANIAIVPIALAFSKRLGYDRLLAFGLSYLAVNAGYSAGEFNIFNTAIAQGIAELPRFSGMGVRIAEHVLFVAVFLFFMIRYMRKIKKDPSQSIAPFDPNEDTLDPALLADTKLTLHQVLAGLVLVGGFAWLIYGATVKMMTTMQLTTIFFFVAVFGGILGGLGIDGTAKSFAKGLQGIAAGAFIVGMAKAISVIMTDGNIIDSIVYYLTIPISAVGSVIGANLMYVFNLFFNLIISSGSGQAVAVMPIMVPLADLTGVTRQVAVETYKLGESLTNIIVPTAGGMMACLGISKINYGKYVKWLIPYMLTTALIGVAITTILQVIQWQG